MQNAQVYASIVGQRRWGHGPVREFSADLARSVIDNERRAAGQMFIEGIGWVGPPDDYPASLGTKWSSD